MTFEVTKKKYPHILDLYNESIRLFENNFASPCVVKLRLFAETMIKELYKEFDLLLPPPPDNNLFGYIANPAFQNKVASKVVIDIFHLLRKNGNIGSHEGKINKEQARQTLSEAKKILVWFNELNDSVNVPFPPIDSFEAIKDMVGAIKLPDFFDDYPFTNGQKELINQLDKFLSTNDCHIFLFKGYAGTGKTYIIKAISEYLNFQRRQVVILAPTGRAAKILREKIGEGQTIHSAIYDMHRLVESTQKQEYQEKEYNTTFKACFKLKDNDNSSNAVYIIDESSMVSDKDSESEFVKFGSGRLLKDLMEFVNIDINIHNKKIIFVGDSAQLPPVNMKTSPALDASYIYKEYKLKSMEYELTEIVRQDKNSGVVKNAQKLRESLNKGYFNRIDRIEGDNIYKVEYETIIDTIVREFNNNFSDTIMIAHSNEDTQGYNKAIRKKLNRPQEVSVGDKLIVINNALINGGTLQILNGDFAIVKEVSKEIEVKSVPIKNSDFVELRFRKVSIELDGYTRAVSVLLLENTLEYEEGFNSKDIKNRLNQLNQALYIDFKIRFDKKSKRII